MGVTAYMIDRLSALGLGPRAHLAPERNAMQGIVIGCAACLPFWIGLGVLTFGLN